MVHCKAYRDGLTLRNLVMSWDEGPFLVSKRNKLSPQHKASIKDSDGKLVFDLKKVGTINPKYYVSVTESNKYTFGKKFDLNNDLSMRCELLGNPYYLLETEREQGDWTYYVYKDDEPVARVQINRDEESPTVKGRSRQSYEIESEPEDIMFVSMMVCVMDM